MDQTSTRAPGDAVRRLRRVLAGTSGLALLTAVGVVALGSGPARADILIWDAGTPGGDSDGGAPVVPIINNANGNWNTTNSNDVWNNAATGAADDFDNGDDVIFAPNSDGSAANVTITVTDDGDVEPNSITFATDTNNNTSFTIVSDEAGDRINSGGGNVTITMNDAATIDAELEGAFTVAGTQLLTLGGNNTAVTSLTINANAQAQNNAGAGPLGDIGGTITNNGTFTNAGTVNDVTNTGTFTSTGVLNNLTSSNGSVSLSGTANGNVSITGGTVDLTGALTGVDTFTLGSGIVLAVDNNLDVTSFANSGAVTITSGDTLDVNGGAGTFTNNASGTLDIDSGGTLDGSIVHDGTGGASSLIVGGDVTGDVQANQAMTLENTGDIGGTLTVAATATVTAQGGEVEAVDNQGTFNLTTTNDVNVVGNFTNDGALAATGGNAATLIVGGNFESTGSIDGGTGSLTIQATAPGALIDLNAGTTLANSVILIGDIENSVALIYGGVGANVEFGATGDTLAGTFTNVDTGSLDINATLNDGGNDIVNTDNGILNVNAGGSFTGDVTNQDNGALNIASGGSIGGGVTNQDSGALSVAAGGSIGGTLTNTSNVTVTLAGNVGGIDNSGAGDIDVTGPITVSGTIQNDATLDILAGTTTVTGLTTNEDDGTLTIAAGATLDGNVTNDSGGLLDVNGTIGDGSPAVTVTNNGTMDLAGTVNGAVTNNEDLVIDGASSITGNLTNTDNLDVGANLTVGGNFLNDTGTGNTAIAAGFTMTVNGTSTNQGGADIVIAGTGVLDADTGLTNTGSDSTLTLNGTVDGSVTNAADALLQVTAGGGSITGTLTNSADVNVAAGQTLGVTGLTTNQSGGTITVNGGASFGTLFQAGGISNLAGGVVDLLGGNFVGTVTNNGGDVNVSGAVGFLGALNNDSGTLNLAAGASLGGLGSVTNGGTLNMLGGSSIGAPLSNSGTLNGSGTVSVTAGLMNSGTIDLSGTTPATGDILNISGGATLNGTAIMDVDLSDGSTASDRINITGTSSGNMTVNFNVVGVPGTAGSPVIIVDYDEVAGSSLVVTGSGLPAGGSTAYFLSNNVAAGYYEVITGVNPAVGGIASSATLIQSLIGSVINRPSSPFVAGLAASDDKPCGAGAWGRATGGVATASGDVESENTSGGTSTFTNEIEASYYGIQLGGDFSCFEGFYSGWDLSFGGFVGLNLGTAELPAFLVDPNSGTVLTDQQTDEITTDFQQNYAGVYVAAARGRFFADLQYRLEQTSYDISNRVIIPALSVGISDQSVSADAQTLSGSVSYVFPLGGQESGIVLVPTAGFSWTKTDAVETINFDDGATLNIQENETQVAFVGATISKTVVQPDGVSALNYFATATAYNDFADPARSLYLPAGALPGNELESLSANLGTYGELSVGVNYTKLLNPGQVLNARQLNASVRVDGRFGDSLESWGVTGQVRLQF